MNVGQKILDEIVKQPMFRMECPEHPEAGCLAVWNGDTAEQIEAIVIEEFMGCGHESRLRDLKKIMSGPAQVAAFACDIQRVIDRYRADFDLTLAAAIGTLEVVKLELYLNETDRP